ncbi:uncharacterized protein LOC134289962 [Aedes albopictus]|uniref:Reverse transcriptase domain-containing protein n=1 Tax=Aedes albopictus TaxID=7160 RepID=A0ABM1ZIN2_AEDAL
MRGLYVMPIPFHTLDEYLAACRGPTIYLPFCSFSVQGKGMFQFTRLPFGLINSPATLARLMNRVLGHGALDPNVFVYLDDIVILSETFEEHVQLLMEVAKRGLINSPATLTRLMNRVFGHGALEPIVFVYLDDIVIVSETFEKHVQLLMEVARRLREAN